MKKSSFYVLLIIILLIFTLTSCSEAQLFIRNASTGSSTTTKQISDIDFIADNDVLPEQKGITSETNENFVINYEKVAETNLLVMYADMTKGHFAVKNKKTSKIWYSTPNDAQADPKTKGKAKLNMQSQIIIDFIYKEDENTNIDLQQANSQTGCVSKNGITVTKIEDGIKVLYNFAEVGIKFTVDYKLYPDYFSANIDLESLDEGSQCFLVAIHLLPTMGAGNWDEKGYMLVPDGCGAIVNFNNNITMLQNYEQMIYGDDLGVNRNQNKSQKEVIRMPVFGTVIKDDALFGIVKDGDGSSAISIINGNSNCGYNAISSKAVLRNHEVINSFYETNHSSNILQISHLAFKQKNYQVIYYPLSGDDATVVGMAKCYRAYLENEKGLEKRNTDPKLNLKAYGSVDLKSNFLGFSYMKQKALISFDAAKQILADLKNQQVKDVALSYVGWFGSGVLNNNLPQKANVLNNIGGEKKFLELSKYCSDNRIKFYPAVDFLRFRKGSNSSKTPAGNNTLLYDYSLSTYEINHNETPLKLIRPTNLLSIAERFGNSLKNLNINSVSLSGIGDVYYSDFSSNGGTHRYQLLDYYTDVLESYKNNGISTVLDGVNAYALPFTSKVYNAPIYSSGIDIFYEDVPFYQLVLHGIVPIAAPELVQSIEPEITFLKAVETGSELTYALINEPGDVLSDSRYSGLYAATYSLWKNDAVKKYKEYYPLLNKISDSTIVKHEQIAKDCYLTGYDNGINVVVNYSDKDISYNGFSIKEKSFLQIN